MNADSTMRGTLGFQPDYYAILGANQDASPREIERLYKRLAHQRHPDRGGAEEDMKVLNEAYGVLRNEKSRRAYDTLRQSPARPAAVNVTPAVREVGFYGLALNALLAIVLGLLLLFLVHFNGLWFLWPLTILAGGVVLFGVYMAHSAVRGARASLAAAHPLQKFRVIQEVIFWAIVAGGAYAVYLVWSFA